MYLFQIVARLEDLAASNPDLKTKVFFTCNCSKLWPIWRSWQPLILTSRLKASLHVPLLQIVAHLEDPAASNPDLKLSHLCMYLFQIVAHLEELAASNPDLKSKVIFISHCFQIVAHLEKLACSNPNLKTEVIGQAKSSLHVTIPDCGPPRGTGSL
jgi:hypothetical protein